MTSNNGFQRNIFKSVKPTEIVTFSSVDELHFVSYVRGEETYGLIFNLASFGRAMVQISKWASHKELSFDWKDCAALTQSMRLYRKKMLDENCSGSKEIGDEHST